MVAIWKAQKRQGCLILSTRRQNKAWLLFGKPKRETEGCPILSPRRQSYPLAFRYPHRSCRLVLIPGTTRLPEIPPESMCFQRIRWTPSDDFPTLLKVLRFILPVLFYDLTESGDLSALDCTSGFIARLDSIGFQVLSTGI